VFFSAEDRYLGILYLTMDGTICPVNPDYLKAVGNETFSLVLERDTHIELFKQLKVPGLKIKVFGSPEAIN
jgi:hypothetical protein